MIRFNLVLVLMCVALTGVVSSCVTTGDLVTRQMLDDAQRRRDRGQLPTATRVPTAVPPSPTLAPTRTPGLGRTLGTVVRVWDGNTILLEGGYTVRYIGINTPGAGMFRRPVEPFGREAAERNLELVEGRQVELEQDVQDLDPNGYLLRYVYVGDVMVNELLLREGLARAAPSGRNVRYEARFATAEGAARQAPVNIWTLITPTATATREPTDTPLPQLTAIPTRTPLPLPPGLPAAEVILTRQPTFTRVLPSTSTVITLLPVVSPSAPPVTTTPSPTVTATATRPPPTPTLPPLRATVVRVR